MLASTGIALSFHNLTTSFKQSFQLQTTQPETVRRPISAIRVPGRLKQEVDFECVLEIVMWRTLGVLPAFPTTFSNPGQLIAECRLNDIPPSLGFSHQRDLCRSSHRWRESPVTKADHASRKLSTGLGTGADRCYDTILGGSPRGPSHLRYRSSSEGR